MPSPGYRKLLLAGLLLPLAFIALNYRAYDGYFQDDELDTLSWAPNLGVSHYAENFVKPFFDRYNFRPTGHLYFTLMSLGNGMDFPPYVTPLLGTHLLNGLLLFLLLRRMGIVGWPAMGGTAFFVLSGAAMDAYWKPMYVFDLFCTTFCLASVLLWTHRQRVLSFVAFWLAYKAKELAVMLPIVLLAWEFWLGDETEGRKRYWRLWPFFLASLSFGLQGLIFNPNKNNDYTFRLEIRSLRLTVPFYGRRLLMFRGSGWLLVPLLFVRDRRVWFGLAGMMAFLSLLLFLPGRRFEAYAYLPLACVAIAVAAAATRFQPIWGALLLAAWLPWNVLQVRKEQREVLRQDDVAAAFVESLEAWVRTHPSVQTLVYEGMPGEYHHWGITGIWNILHKGSGMKALFRDWPEAREALNSGPVAYVRWDNVARKAVVSIHSPLPQNTLAPTPQPK
ncbi:MAG: hypothetical protein JWN34_4931 [Bryobacterales bacterium]|nr:hypothetical protein [Bryobacterales bacterium]